LEILTTSQPDGSLFQVGISTEDRLLVLGRFREALVTVAIPLILLAVAGGAVLSTRVLLPLRNLIGTIASIESGKMDARVPNTQTGDELEELGSLFNSMIEKINQLIRAMRGSLDSVAHDLRTPMTRFRNNAEKALQTDVSGSACHEALQDCVEESDRILKMLAMLMDISEAETGTMRLLLCSVDLVPLTEGVTDMYRYVADEKGIGIETDFPEEARLNADADRISQVVANLLDNAVKFTPEGGAVGVSIRKLGQTVIVSVTDSGIGIDPGEIHRIWDRLYRGARSSHKGLGLGLSLVKAVVNAHHGDMRVSSTPGAGSTFEIHLPAASIPPIV
jgi:signal transduction histidine kinase